MNVSLEEFMLGLEMERKRRANKKKEMFILMRDYRNEMINRLLRRCRSRRKK